MNIIVLCGGLSAERDVSITSGTLAAGALRRLGHKVVLMDLFFGYPHPYNDPAEIFERQEEISVAAVGEQVPDLESLRRQRGQTNNSRMGDNVLEVCRAAGIVFVALHGQDGEDGKIQAAFDLAGVKYTGTGCLGSALAMDKWMAKQILQQNGIKTAEAILLKKGGPVSDIGFPCVVKPRSGGSSIGTSIVFDATDYAAALEQAFAYDAYVLVEQYIKGRECDVGVIDGKALPVIEICPKSGFYDYKNKYQSGLTDEYCPADLPDEITERLQRAAERVYEALCFEVYGRMDFIVDAQGEVWCLEGNTLPGMTPTSLMPQEAAAAGISYEELCQTIVDLSLKKYEVK